MNTLMLFQHEMSLKTTAVNLGVVKENPSTNEGCARIGDHMSKFLPTEPDGSPLETGLFCDQGFNERMIGAKRIRCTSREKLTRLDGLQPFQGDFHKRIVYYGDLLKIYLQRDKTTSRGTLSNIIATQKFTSVTYKVRYKLCIIFNISCSIHHDFRDLSA